MASELDRARRRLSDVEVDAQRLRRERDSNRRKCEQAVLAAEVLREELEQLLEVEKSRSKGLKKDVAVLLKRVEELEGELADAAKTAQEDSRPGTTRTPYLPRGVRERRRDIRGGAPPGTRHAGRRDGEAHRATMPRGC